MDTITANALDASGLAAAADSFVAAGDKQLVVISGALDNALVASRAAQQELDSARAESVAAGTHVAGETPRKSPLHAVQLGGVEVVVSTPNHLASLLQKESARAVRLVNAEQASSARSSTSATAATIL